MKNAMHFSLASEKVKLFYMRLVSLVAKLPAFSLQGLPGDLNEIFN